MLAIPQDYGSHVTFDFYLSEELVTNPNSTSGSSSSDTSSTSSSSTNSGVFNSFSRKLLSYALSSLFGLVFIAGVINIYRVFFSNEAKMRKLFEQELRRKKLE